MPRNDGFKSRPRSTRGTWHNQKFEAIWTQSDKKLNSCCVALDLKGQDFWRTELSHSTRRKVAVNRWRLATHTTTTTTREAMPQHIDFSELAPARRRLRLRPRAKWTLTFHRRVIQTPISEENEEKVEKTEWFQVKWAPEQLF